MVGLGPLVVIDNWIRCLQAEYPSSHTAKDVNTSKA